MKNYLTIIILSIILNSCSDLEKQHVIYSNYNFDLPIEVKKAEDLFTLSFGESSGFYKTTSGERLIETQLENYPIFMGTDNVQRADYYGDYFVGVIFYEDYKIQSFDKLKRSLESQYKNDFNQRVEEQITSVEHLDIDMEFFQLKTETGLNVILKKVKRRLTNKEFVAIAFYPNLSDKALIENITWIN